MKHLKYLFPMLLVTLFLSSCGEDDGPITPSTEPTSSIDNSAITISAMDSFTVFLSATAQSTNPLKTLTVQKQSEDLGLDVVLVDDAPIGANPKLLLGTDKSSFNFKITVITDLDQGQSADYQFIVTAENGDVTREIVTVTVEQPTTPPTIALSGEITESNDLYQIPIQVTKGDSDLSTIAVYENGALAAASRLTLGAMSVWSENPYTLGASMQGGINETLLMSIPTTSGDYNYMIIVTDAADLKDTLAYNLTLELGTPLTGGVAGVKMENFAGPNPTGGLDATTGAVGGSAAAAHIMDNGNGGDDQWLSQIKIGTAGEELRRVSGAFADYDTKEAISSAYDQGTTGTLFTVTAGELYVVKGTDGVYYLLEVTEVVNTPTVGDNADYYTINTKY